MGSDHPSEAVRNLVSNDSNSCTAYYPRQEPNPCLTRIDGPKGVKVRRDTARKCEKNNEKQDMSGD